MQIKKINIWENGENHCFFVISNNKYVENFYSVQTLLFCTKTFCFEDKTCILHNVQNSMRCSSHKYFQIHYALQSVEQICRVLCKRTTFDIIVTHFIFLWKLLKTFTIDLDNLILKASTFESSLFTSCSNTVISDMNV